jgi:very-short-patch-repair endonuclease
MYENGISPTQIAKLFDHEIGLATICLEISTFVDSNGAKRDVHPFNRSLTLSNFSNRLKEIIPYSRDHHMLHLKQPQWKKIRYEHLEQDENAVKELASTQLRDWAKETQQKRRESGTYTKKYSIDYWLGKGLAYEDALKSLVSYKNSISPMRVEFWMRKGFDINESKKIISNQGKLGAVSTLKNLNGSCVSILEKRIFELLDNSNLSQQIFIGPYAYDIGSKKLKKLIEINGTYWHADPRVYNSCDLMFGTRIAHEVWSRDFEKKSYAEKHGYQVHVVWELDFCKNPNQTIDLINKFLKGDE